MFDTAWNGTVVPCVTSAVTLFCVVTFGDERIFVLPLCSSAVSATSMLNAPFTAPSDRPTPVDGVIEPDCAGRLTTEPDAPTVAGLPEVSCAAPPT